jgi:hypothetical protein
VPGPLWVVCDVDEGADDNCRIQRQWQRVFSCMAFVGKKERSFTGLWFCLGCAMRVLFPQADCCACCRQLLLPTYALASQRWQWESIQQIKG